MSDSSTNRFARFRAAHQPDPWAAGPFSEWTGADTESLLGWPDAAFTAFVRTAATTSFDQGTFCVLPPSGDLSLRGWNGVGGWKDDWPDFADAVAFAYDWAARLYVLDAPSAGGSRTVARLEPETGGLMSLSFIAPILHADHAPRCGAFQMTAAVLRRPNSAFQLATASLFCSPLRPVSELAKSRD